MTKTIPGKDSCSWLAFIGQITGLLFVLFSFTFSCAAFAADTDLEKGFAAAQKERWDQAVDYFGKAFAANPYNPIVQFNFGLTQEKAGNELVAIALLNTYLAAVPETANRDQVELLIDQLVERAEQKSKRFFDVAIEAVEAWPAGPFGENINNRRWKELRIISNFQIESGYLEEAKRTLEIALGILNTTNQRDEQVQESTFRFARQDFEKYVQNPPSPYEVRDLGINQAKAHDFAAAEQTRDQLIAGGLDKNTLVGVLIGHRILKRLDERNFKGAEELLDNPGTLYGLVPENLDNNSEFKDAIKKLFWIYFNEGDLEKAESFARKHLRADPNYFNSIAIEWLRLGNISKAQTLAATAVFFAPDDWLCTRALSAAVQGQRTTALAISKRMPIGKFAPNETARCIASVANIFAFLGDVEGTNAAFKLVREREVPYEGKRYISPWAKPYPDLAAGKFKRAQRLIDRIEIDNYRDLLREDLIYTALARSRPELAEQFARSYNKSDIFPVIADRYEALGDLAAATRLRKEVRLKEEKRRAGWTAKDLQHQRAVDALLQGINLLLTGKYYEGYDDSVRNMEAFISEAKTKAPHMMNYSLITAGKIWAREIMRIRNRVDERRSASKIN